MLIKKKRIPIKQLVLIGFLPSFLKIIIYRLKGYNIGKNVTIGLGTVIISDDVVIKDNSNIGFLSIIKAKKINIDRFVTIGSFVYIDTEQFIIGEDSRLREHVYAAGQTTAESILKIGKRSCILQYSFLNPTKALILGDDSSIGGSCHVFTHGSYLSVLDGYPVKYASVKIGNNVWIPWNVFIESGVTIGDNVLIGASSHVSKDIPSNCIATGNPARIKVKNFPFPLTEVEKENIIKEILSEFEKYLVHNEFEVNISINKSISIYDVFRVRKHQLIYSNENCEYKCTASDNVLLLNYDTNITDIYKSNSFPTVNVSTVALACAHVACSCTAGE